MDQLSAAKGKDFDDLYLDMRAQAHMEAVGLFRTYAGSEDNQTIVGFAKETLPALETHRAHVEMLVVTDCYLADTPPGSNQAIVSEHMSRLGLGENISPQPCQ